MMRLSNWAPTIARSTHLKDGFVYEGCSVEIVVTISLSEGQTSLHLIFGKSWHFLRLLELNPAFKRHLLAVLTLHGNLKPLTIVASGAPNLVPTVAMSCTF